MVYSILAAVVVAAVLVSILRILPPDEIGAVDWLGNPFYEKGPGGLVLVIPGLMDITRFDTQTRQRELPTEPEMVQKDHQDRVDPGKKATIRIVQRGADTSLWFDEKGFIESGRPFDDFFKYMIPWEQYLKEYNIDDDTAVAIQNHPHHQTATTEVSAIVEWRHKIGEGKRNLQGGCFDFIRNVHSDELADQRLEDEVVRNIQRVLSVITPGHALERESIISDYILHRVEILTGDVPLKDKKDNEKYLPNWGIDLLKTAIKLIDPGETINKAVAEAASASAKRQETIKDAEAAGTATRIAADASAYEEKAKAKGRAAAIKAIGEAMQNPGAKYAAALETTEKVAPDAKIIIADPIGGSIAAVMKMAQGAADLGQEIENKDKNKK
jgi:regulator of protease activity HflC (stomatin/prohibitin superfamily)